MAWDFSSELITLLYSGFYFKSPECQIGQWLKNYNYMTFRFGIEKEKVMEMPTVYQEDPVPETI